MSAVINSERTDMFQKHVTACVDSLPLFRKKYPISPTNRNTLHEHYWVLHNALSDVEALRKVLALFDVKDVMSVSFSPSAVKHSVKCNCAKSRNLRSLDP